MFDIWLTQVLCCFYRFSGVRELKERVEQGSQNSWMTVIKGRIWPCVLIVLLSSASCTSNTMVIWELAVSVPFTRLLARPEPHQEKGRYFKVFSCRLSIIFFSSLQFILFLCVKNHFPSSGEIFPIPCPLYSQLPWPSFYLSFHTIHNLGCFQTILNFYFVLNLFVAWKTKHINLKQTLNCLWG